MEAEPARHRSNNFDALRLLLAAMVLAAHGPELRDGNRDHELLTALFHTYSQGEVAVNGFFALSGMLISQSWLRSGSIAEYFGKRIRRIYPGFAVAFLVSVLVVGALGAANAFDYWSAIQPTGVITDILLLRPPSVPPCFLGRPHPSEINGSLWTIRIEFLCYILVAILGRLGVLNRKGFCLALFGIVALTYIFCCARVRFLSWNSVFPGLNPTGISVLQTLTENPFELLRLVSFFLAGVCVGAFQERFPRWIDPRGAVLAAVGLFVTLFFGDGDLVIAAFAFLTFGVYLLFWAGMTGIGKQGAQHLSLPVDISYGTYLYGWPVLKLIVWYAPQIPLWLLLSLSVALSLCCGAISWYAVEHWFLRRSPKWPGRTVSSASAG